MKKQLAKLILLGWCAAAILAAPALSRAQDATNAPVASAPVKHKHKRNTLPYRGYLAALDTNAMTITVGNLSLQVTSATRITKDGNPAVLADGVVGQPVSGSYKKGTDGMTNAVSIHFGKTKKKSSSESTSSPASSGN
jgi:hypothetical protein